MEVKRSVLWTCVALLLVNMGCSDSQESRAAKERQKLNEFATIMHLSFPAGTRLLNYRVDRGMDDFICVKVEIPKQDLEAFLKSSPFADKVLKSKEEDRIPAVSLSGPTWWKVKSVSRWLAGQAALPEAEYLNILLDLDHPDKVIIYIEWFET